MEAVVTLTIQDDSPTVIDFVPDPDILTTDHLLIIIAVCIQKLKKRHGLEQSLKFIEDVAYGSLPNGDAFKLLFREIPD